MFCDILVVNANLFANSELIAVCGTKYVTTFVQKLRLQVLVSINEKYFPFPDDEAIHPAVQYSY